MAKARYGVAEQYLSRDIGGYWRNEVNWSPFSLLYLGNITLLSAVDGDYLRQDSQDTYASGTLWGSVVGLGSHSRYFGSQLTVGWPLSHPSWLKPDRVSVYYRINIVL